MRVLDVRIDENLMHTKGKSKRLSLLAEFAARTTEKCHTSGDATAGHVNLVFPVPRPLVSGPANITKLFVSPESGKISEGNKRLVNPCFKCVSESSYVNGQMQG